MRYDIGKSNLGMRKKNPRRQATRETQVGTVAPCICGPSGCAVLPVWRTEFWSGSQTGLPVKFWSGSQMALPVKFWSGSQMGLPVKFVEPYVTDSSDI